MCRRYGITHTLDQVFLAPALVKHVLCDEVNINRSFVGTEQTQVWGGRGGAQGNASGRKTIGPP